MLSDAPTVAGLVLTEPLGYLDFLALQANAAAVLTDSGGIQEETTYLGVRCFTLRDNTERPVTIRLGTNTLLGLDPRRISTIFPSLSANKSHEGTAPPLWDGRAAERVADILEGTLTEPRRRSPVMRLGSLSTSDNDAQA
jgi:UDP-N-acetylglucosamine 2-epimerase (non-hydrolysing)